MERGHPSGCPRLAQEILGDALPDVGVGADPIDRLLRLAVAAVAPLHGVRSGGEGAIIQEGQSLLEVAREERLPGLADVGEALDPLAVSMSGV